MLVTKLSSDRNASTFFVIRGFRLAAWPMSSRLASFRNLLAMVLGGFGVVLASTSSFYRLWSLLGQRKRTDAAFGLADGLGIPPKPRPVKGHDPSDFPDSVDC